jgi:hypothetical protein
MRMERTSRALYGAALLLLLAGLIFRIVPAPAGAIESPIRAGGDSTSVVPAATPKVPGADTVIVDGNIFSASRSAPRERYLPPDLAPAQAAQRARPRRTSPRLRLMGTVSGSAALIDANPSIPGAEIYQIGDLVDGKQPSSSREHPGEPSCACSLLDNPFSKEGSECGALLSLRSWSCCLRFP